MKSIQIETIPDTAFLLDVANRANAQHLKLITNGKRCVLCSIIPPGWKLMPVIEKKINPCAA